MESWETGEAEISYGYKAGDSRKNGDYVTVTDSIMVCTVSYPGFSFDYELLYQVAVYDDHVTRQVMPYHKYENIVDNGCELSELEDASENGVTYKRQKCVHSLTVTFNGKEYKVSSELILKKAQKGEDKLLAAKVVDEGIEFVKTGDWSGKTVSWILIEQTWSESGTKTFKKEALLKHYVLFPQEIFRFDAGEKYAVLDDISLEISTDPQIREEGTAVDGVAIDVYKEDQRVEMRKNDDENLAFTTLTTAVFERARYVDDKLSCDFPVPAVYSDFAASYHLVHGWQETVNDDGFPCWQAEYEFRFVIKYGDNVYSSELPWFLEYRERE